MDIGTIGRNIAAFFDTFRKGMTKCVRHTCRDAGIPCQGWFPPAVAYVPATWIPASCEDGGVPSEFQENHQ